MTVIGIIVALVFFAIAFLGLVYPIIPSALVMVIGFVAYGMIASFDEMSWLFWSIQILFLILLFVADTLSNLVGVKKFGGSRAGMWGSTIGLLLGPFVIPIAGILLGPFLGAILAEFIVKKRTLKQAFVVGIGSLVGFLTSIVTKGTLMIVMVILFFIFI